MMIAPQSKGSKQSLEVEFDENCSQDLSFHVDIKLSPGVLQSFTEPHRAPRSQNDQIMTIKLKMLSSLTISIARSLAPAWPDWYLENKSSNKYYGIFLFTK